jgi:hypothetical protein
MKPPQSDVRWDGAYWRSADGRWVWYGSTWIAVRPRRRPSRRVVIAGIIAGSVLLLAAVPFIGILANNVLFPSPNNLSDTWTYDGHTWRQVDGGTNPGKLGFAGMAWDTAGQQLILFARGKTWSFDMGHWTELHPRHAPPAIDAMVSTPDSIMLIAPTGTWSWRDGDWTDLNARPPGRGKDGGPPQLVYDSASGTVLSFSDDVRVWDRGSWTSLGPWPPDSVTAAYDPGQDAVMSIGCNDTSCKKVWSWSANKEAPVLLGDVHDWVGARLIYYPPSGQTLEFAESATMVVYQQTAPSKWVYRPVGSAPDGRTGYAMAFDPRAGLIVMYGGCAANCYSIGF